MPSPRRGIHRRRAWTEEHFWQLAGGFDFCNEAFGELHLKQSEEELRATVEEMAECYAACRDQVVAVLPDVGRVETPWFEQYVGDTERLVQEHLANWQYRRDYPHGESCRCEKCESQPTTPAPAPVE